MNKKDENKFNHESIINDAGKLSLWLFLGIWALGGVLKFDISWLNFFSLFFYAIIGGYLGEWLKRNLEKED